MGSSPFVSTKRKAAVLAAFLLLFFCIEPCFSGKNRRKVTERSSPCEKIQAFEKQGGERYLLSQYFQYGLVGRMHRGHAPSAAKRGGTRILSGFVRYAVPVPGRRLNAAGRTVLPAFFMRPRGNGDKPARI